MSAPTFIHRRANGRPCVGCGLEARGLVAATDRRTGERAELPLCHRCRETPDRTVWRRVRGDVVNNVRAVDP